MNKSDSGYNRLSADAVKAWRVNGGLWSLLFWAIPVFFGVINFYDGNVPLWLILTTVLIAVIITIVLVIIVPRVRWKQWRYRIDKHEIDLHHGIWFTRQTLVPVKRVQHVDTRQGPILRQYYLADIVISTAATTHKIPALTEEIADEARSEISVFARKAKDDV